MNDRLGRALDQTTGKRFLLLYGVGLTDVFMDESLNERSFEVTLLSELKSRGFKRAIFVSPHRSIFFLDEPSRELTWPRNELISAVPCLKQMQYLDNGPLSSIMLFESREHSDEDPSLESMGDTLSIRFLDTLIRDETFKTAIILVQAESILSYFENPRVLSGLIGDWTRLPTSNQNACIFLFAADSYDQLVELAPKLHLPELRSMILQRSQVGGVHALLSIGFPGYQEIVHIVSYLQRSGGLQTDCVEAVKMCKWMTAENISARQWITRLKSIKTLDITALKGRGWISSTRDPGNTAIDQINSLIGLEEMKQRIQDWLAWLSVAEKKNVLFSKRAEHSLHMLFIGNPGTGKTTVARLMGEALHDIGLLNRGQLIEVKGSDLIADHVGGTAIKTNNAIDRAIDGVLFVDEAYMLSEPERGGFGSEALETLLARLENDRERLVVILAGYPSKMKRLLDSNPGLERRFPKDNIFNFPDFIPAELWQIFRGMLDSRNLVLPTEFEFQFKSVVERLYIQKDEFFGNAGEIRNLVEAIERRHAVRIHREKLPLDAPLQVADIPNNYQDLIRKDTPGLESVLVGLDGLIGLQPAKDYIHCLLRRTLYDQVRSQKNPSYTSSVALVNLIFTGNPGSGKTTLARMVGEIYHSLGMLKKGHCVEVSRAELVASYVGQTAIRTKEKLREALDGVFFIDEAYSLYRPEANDFGLEAIDTLVKYMEDYKNRLVVIVAGYPERMGAFMSANPGLRSRFGKVLEFPDLPMSDLVEILLIAARKEHFLVPGEVTRQILNYLSTLKDSSVDFGNARAALGLFEHMKNHLADRIMSGPAGADLSRFESDECRTFTPQDVPAPEGIIASNSALNGPYYLTLPSEKTGNSTHPYPCDSTR
jgi:AAA+ superfamily predicted ATPase